MTEKPDALSIACPVCGAAVGARCHNSYDNVLSDVPHISRVLIFRLTLQKRTAAFAFLDRCSAWRKANRL